MKAPTVHGWLPPATAKTSFSATPASAFMKNDLPVLAAPQMVIRFSGFCGSFPTAEDASADTDTHSEPEGLEMISSRLTDISTTGPAACNKRERQKHEKRLGCLRL